MAIVRPEPRDSVILTWLWHKGAGAVEEPHMPQRQLHPWGAFKQGWDSSSTGVLKSPEEEKAVGGEMIARSPPDIASASQIAGY